MKSKLYPIALRIITAIIIILLANNLTPFAQTQRLVSGKVMTDSSKLLGGATVSVYQLATGKLHQSILTDTDGKFALKIDFLNQYLYVTHIGYVPYKLSNAQKESLIVTLKLWNQQIGEVIIKSKKAFIEQQFDRLIANVDGDSKAGINATDILKKLPGVAIMNDNTVMYEGKAVTVYLDGKLIRLSGNELMALLRNTPSAVISQIEVIHSPSAKYDAQGDGGLINIKSIRRLKPGYDGYISLTGGHGWKYFYNNNISTGVNYRSGNNYLYGSYSYGLGTQSQEIQTNTYLMATGQRLLDSMKYQSPYSDQNIRLGWDHFPNKTEVIGILVTGYKSYNEPVRTSETGIFTLAGTVPDSTGYSDNKNSRSSKGININVNYKTVLDSIKRREVSMDADAGLFYYDNTNFLNISLQEKQALPPSNLQELIQSGKAQTQIFSYKADYTQKLHYGNLDGGVKTSYVIVNNNFKSESSVAGNGYQNNGSNDFVYKETVLATYINSKQTWQKLTLQVGVRAELTFNHSNSVTLDSVVDRNYLNLFPNLSMGYKLKNNSLSASYTRRIGRPVYSYLNPFVIIESAYSAFRGNPYLLPSFTDNYRLGFNFFNNKLSFSLTYSASKDVIADLALLNDQTKITTRLKANLSEGQSSGFNFGYNYRFFKMLEINYSGTLRYSRYNFNYAGAPVQVAQFTGQAYINNQLTLPQNWWLNIYTFASTKVTYGNNITLPMTTTAVSGGTKILNGKGTLSLSINDVFFTGIQRSKTNYGNIQFDNRSQYDSRNVRLNFTYNFGNTKINVRDRTSGSTDEQRRN